MTVAASDGLIMKGTPDITPETVKVDVPSETVIVYGPAGPEVIVTVRKAVSPEQMELPVMEPVNVVSGKR